MFLEHLIHCRKIFLEHFIHCRSVVDGTRAALFDDHLNSVPPRSSPSSIAVHDIPNRARAFFDYPAAIRAGAVHGKRLLPYSSARLCTLANLCACASSSSCQHFLCYVVCKTRFMMILWQVGENLLCASSSSCSWSSSAFSLSLREVPYRCSSHVCD